MIDKLQQKVFALCQAEAEDLHFDTVPMDEVFHHAHGKKHSANLM